MTNKKDTYTHNKDEGKNKQDNNHDNEKSQKMQQLLGIKLNLEKTDLKQP